MRALVSGLHRIPEESAPPAVLQAILRRVPVRKRRSWWPFSFEVGPGQLFAGCAAAAVAVAAIMVVLPGKPQVQVASAPQAAPSMAMLVGPAQGLKVDGAPAPGNVALRDGGRVELAAAAGGDAQLAYADGSVVSLRPGTRLVAGKAEVRLETGTLELSIEKQKLNFRVRTPEALVTVWGTRYTVTHGTATSVEVQEGRVQVQSLKDAGDGVMLIAGQKAEVLSGRLQAVQAPAAADAAAPEDTRLPLGDDR
jgi:ferric-dicitrate binding protein FerR (iron transport regulator)